MANVFDLTRKKDFYLSLLLKRLQRNNDTKLSRILHESSLEVMPEYEYDSLDGGQSGHKINLFVNAELFLDIVDDKNEYESALKDNFNKIYTPKNEYICDVEIGPSDSLNSIPINASLIYSHNKMPSVSEDDLVRIWKNKNNLKVFISHRDADKVEASKIQFSFSKYNISSFVAHEDIEGTEEWIKEILRALQTMDVFMVYMTKDFFNSNWTNQEVGFALGRNIPIIPIKNRINPEGFISILQAKQYVMDSFCQDFISLLLKPKDMHIGLKEKTIDCLIDALAQSKSWENAESIYGAFQHVKSMNQEQAERLIKAFNANSQINECITISGYDCYGNRRGSGDICLRLEKWTGNKYTVSRSNGKVKIQTAVAEDPPFDLGAVFPSFDDAPF